MENDLRVHFPGKDRQHGHPDQEEADQPEGDAEGVRSNGRIGSWREAA